MRMKLGLGLALLVTALGAGACSSDDGPVGPDGTTTLRVINTSPDVASVDVVVDGQVIGTGVGYTQSTGYKEVEDEPDNLAVAATSNAQVILTSGLDMDEQQGYSVFVMGRANALTAVQFLDDFNDPATGAAKLRIVDASSGITGNVDVYITDPSANLATATPSVPNLAFKSASQYFQVPAGTYSIRVTAVGTKTVLAELTNVALAAGAIRTAPIVDGVSGQFLQFVYTLVDKN